MHPQKQILEGGMKASGIHASSVILIAIVWILLAGVPAHGMITFEKTYGGTSWDWGTSVQQTPDGGYVVAGFTESFGAGLWDFYLVKTDSMGTVTWDTTYGGNLDDASYSVQQTLDGGFIIAGFTESFGAGYRDFYLVKTDSLGNLLWDATYGDSSSYEIGSSVQQTSDGGYIVVGRTMGPSSTNVYLVKADSLGNLTWDATYGDSLYQGGYSVVQTQDGGYIIAGSTYLFFGSDSSDVYLIKTDSLGDTLWTKTFGGNLSDRGSSIQQTQDGGYIIAGATESFGAGSTDVYLIKTDSAGTVLWDTTYGGSYADVGRSVYQTLDGGYIITGVTGDWPTWDVYLIRTDSGGILLWERTYPGGSFPDGGSSVQETSDGGYIIAGFTLSFGAGSYDIYLIKTDSLGQVLGIQERDPELKIEKRKPLQNKPNPFHGSTLISYSLPASAYVTLQVFDITGRLVETLVNETQERGAHKVQWNSKDNPSGIYFCRLQVGVFTDTRKMLLLR
ncbi:T9SS type A sorting domain-containing protein [candidate division TA06 bacterium]|uniref:T9SS type A sorting domain-containing protein n=1 Tax=candidate division TA06 bacterium TaxID=2250710 RepID=A0A523UTB8_UNCT6|nr:MAG: T9SS type A sorting domain-containing protein [candidate division TA06 bacterium]